MPIGTEAAPPPALSGFDEIKRYQDPRSGRVAAKILPGEYYVTTADELITTVLGSCVAACVWDPTSGVGGMNHFMIPGGDGVAGGSDRPDAYGVGRHGVYAMEFLVNGILKHGGSKERLQVKLAGGGQVLRSSIRVGADNVAFARQYVIEEGLELVGEHVEGRHARRLEFFPLTGRSRVLELPRQDREVVEQDQTYANEIEQRDRGPEPGEIELF